MKNICLLLLIFIISSCGEKTTYVKNNPKIYIDNAYPLIYSEYYDITSDKNIISISYDDMVFLYNKDIGDNIFPLAQTFSSILLEKNIQGDVSYEYIKNDIRKDINFDGDNILNVSVYKGNIYVLTNSNLYKVTIGGAKIIQELATSNQSNKMIVHNNKLFFTETDLDNKVRLYEFERTSTVLNSITEFNVVNGIVSINNELLSLFGTKEGDPYTVIYNNQGFFEIVNTSDTSLMQLPLSYNGGNLLAVESISKDVFLYKSSEAYSIMNSTNFTNASYMGGKLFFAKDSNDLSFKILKLNNTGEVVVVFSQIDNSSLINLNSMFTINENIYFKIETDSNYKILKYNVNTETITLVQSVEEDFQFYLENDNLLIEKIEDNFLKLYDLELNFIRNRAKI